MYFRSFAAVACVVEPICGRKTGCSMKKEALGYSSSQLSFPATLIKPVTVYLSDQPSSNIFHNNLHHLFLCTAQLKEVDTDSLTPFFLNKKNRKSSEWKRKSAIFFWCGFMALRKDADGLCCCCSVADALMATLLLRLLQLLLLLRCSCCCFSCYCCCSYKTQDEKRLQQKGILVSRELETVWWTGTHGCLQLRDILSKQLSRWKKEILCD